MPIANVSYQLGTYEDFHLASLLPCPVYKIKNRNVDLLIGQNSVLKKIMQAAAPAVVNVARKSPRMKRLSQKFRRMNLEKPKLDGQLRKHIIQEIYFDDIEKLQELLGRDLSHWLN